LRLFISFVFSDVDVPSKVHWAGTIAPGMHDDLHMGIVIDGEPRKSTGHGRAGVIATGAGSNQRRNRSPSITSWATIAFPPDDKGVPALLP
jgi:hypothetical protein